MIRSLKTARRRAATWLLATVLVALTGCVSELGTRAPIAPENLPAKLDLNNKPWVKQVLYAQFDQWRSVKYKAGGLSRDGVDCSGFVYLTFNSRFGITLPRSTDLLVNAGKPIDQQALLPGDLVFFKTGKTLRHVGIYLEDGKFVHASTDKGVMISRLDEAYWARTYWKSVRVQA